MKKIIYYIVFIYSLFLSSCYEELKNTSTVAKSLPYISSDDFTGITSIQNLTTGIQLNWTPVSDVKNISGYNIYKTIKGVLTKITTVPSNNSFYIDGNVVSGSKYQYMVRALDTAGKEDENSKKLSIIAWSGLTSVQEVTRSTITVNFSSSIKGAFIDLYLEGENRSKTFIKKISSTEELLAGSYTINNWPDGKYLKSGASYIVYGNIGETGSSTTDGNQKEYPITLNSVGFTVGDSGETGWQNIATARVFGDSAGNQQDTSNILFDANISPDIAQVELGFLPFNLPSSITADQFRYVVFRFIDGTFIDTSSITATCSNTNFSNPCIVQNNIHPINDLNDGLFIIKDTQVYNRSTPTVFPKFRYTMVIKHLDSSNSSTGFVELLPSSTAEIDQFSVLIQIPPKHMVLVNREAANYEYCLNVGADPNPISHNSCTSSEIGNVPENSNAGSPKLEFSSNQIYDFGYNLFVDRYPIACKADETNFGGTFSVTNIATSVTTLSDPTSSNDTLFLTESSSSLPGASSLSGCIYRPSLSGTSVEIFDIFNSANSYTDLQKTTAITAALTNEPGYPRFSHFGGYFNAENADQVCQAFGKRLPRMREFRTFTAAPFQNIPRAINDLYLNELSSSIVQSGDPWSYGDCLYDSGATTTNYSTNFLNNLTSFANVSFSPTVSGMLNANVNNTSKWQAFNYSSSNYHGPISFLNGAGATHKCMSKYGVQEVVETVALNVDYLKNNVNTAWYPLSDMMYYSYTGTVSATMLGMASNIDSGNIDLSYDSVNYPLQPTYTGFKNDSPAITTSMFTSNTSYIRGDTHSTVANFNFALGLPVFNTNISAYIGHTLPDPTSTLNYGVNNILNFNITSYAQPINNSTYYAQAAARYSTALITNTPGTRRGIASTRMRCVQPAN